MNYDLPRSICSNAGHAGTIEAMKVPSLAAALALVLAVPGPQAAGMAPMAFATCLGGSAPSLPGPPGGHEMAGCHAVCCRRPLDDEEFA